MAFRTGELPPRAIIPRRFVQHVMQNFGKAKSPVRLSYGPAGFSNQPDSDLAPEKKGAPRMSFGGLLDRGLRLMLVSKLIDGTFPDYTRVVPTMNDRAVRLKRADLLGAVRGLTPLATCKTRAVKITAAVGAVTVSLNAVDLGDGQVPPSVAFTSAMQRPAACPSRETRRRSSSCPASVSS